jgi:L-fuconolactonase
MSFPNSEDVVVVQAAATETTRYLFELAKQHPFIAAVVGGWTSAHPMSRSASGLVHGRQAPKVRPWFRHVDPEWLAAPQLDRAFQSMIKHDLAFDALVSRDTCPCRGTVGPPPRAEGQVDHAAKPDEHRPRWIPVARLERIAQHTRQTASLWPAHGGTAQALVARTDPVVGFLVRLRATTALLGERLAGADPFGDSTGSGCGMARTLVNKHALGCEEQVRTNAARLYRLTGWKD